MSEISRLQSVNTQYQATIAVLEQTLKAQQEMIENLLAAMGIGTQIDVEA
jgi:hypothetical protein